MSGSTALLLASVAPDMVRSTHGDRSQSSPGRSSPARLSSPTRASVRFAARAVAADRNLFGRVAFAAQAPPDGQRVVARGRKGMLGGQAVGDGQGAQAPCPSGLGHQSAVADNRTRAIASAMKVDQHAGSVGAGNDRPFALDPVEIDRLELDVVRDRPDRPDLLDPASALFPAHRPRLGAEERANGVDFGLRHPCLPSRQPIAHRGDASFGARDVKRSRRRLALGRQSSERDERLRRSNEARPDELPRAQPLPQRPDRPPSP